MKILAKTVVVSVLLIVATSPLYAYQSTVLRISAFLPKTSCFTTQNNRFTVASNTHNFTYQVEQAPQTKMLFVMAN